MWWRAGAWCHCLNTEKSWKFLFRLSSIWAWLLTRADNQIYSHPPPWICRTPQCVPLSSWSSSAHRQRPDPPSSPTVKLITPCRNTNLCDWKKKSLLLLYFFFGRGGLTLLESTPGFSRLSSERTALSRQTLWHRHTSVCLSIAEFTV